MNEREAILEAMESQTIAIRDRVLSALQPDHQAEPPAKWQQRKSAKMRDRLVSAAVDCLVESGYPGLTTAAVAARSAVSRDGNGPPSVLPGH